VKGFVRSGNIIVNLDIVRTIELTTKDGDLAIQFNLGQGHLVFWFYNSKEERERVFASLVTPKRDLKPLPFNKPI
jgi:hypothetical protein